jgi:hypothetical protein
MSTGCAYRKLRRSSCVGSHFSNKPTLKKRFSSSGRQSLSQLSHKFLALDADLPFPGPFFLWPLLEPLSTLARAASRVETLAARSINWGMNFRYFCLSTMEAWPAYSLMPFIGTPAIARFAKQVWRRSWVVHPPGTLWPFQHFRKLVQDVAMPVIRVCEYANGTTLARRFSVCL